MTKPILGIDLDGVCADFIGGCLLSASEESKINFKNGTVDNELEQRISTVINNPDYYLNLEPIRDSILSTQALSKFYDIWYITARPMEVLPETLNWLRINSFPDWQNVYQSTEKGLACLALSTEAMVEDQVHHAINVANWGIKVWLFEQPYNRKVQITNPIIERVHCWNDLLFYLLFPRKG